MSMLNHFFNYKPEVLALDEKAMELCQPYFRHMEEIRDFNQLKMLKAFAGRLKRSVRNSDIVARIGGDEFLLYVEYKGGIQKVGGSYFFTWYPALMRDLRFRRA